MTPVHEEVAQIEAEMEALAEKIEHGRKVAVLAKALVAAGSLALVLLVVGVLRGSPGVLLFGIAAVLGGFTLLGSNRTTTDQFRERLSDAQAKRNALISGMHLHLVP